jgi:hypothetical protein
LSAPERATRERAHQSLERAGPAARPAVAGALAKRPTGEAGDRLAAIARVIGAGPAVAPPAPPPPAPAPPPEPSRRPPHPKPRVDLRVAQMLAWLAASDSPHAAEAARLLEGHANAADAKLRAVAVAAVNARQRAVKEPIATTMMTTTPTTATRTAR